MQVDSCWSSWQKFNRPVISDSVSGAKTGNRLMHCRRWPIDEVSGVDVNSVLAYSSRMHL